MNIKVLNVNLTDVNREERENKFGKKYYLDRFSCEDEKKTQYSRCTYFNYSGERVKKNDVLVGNIEEDKEYNGVMSYLFKKPKQNNFGGGGQISTEALTGITNAINNLALSTIFSGIFKPYMEELKVIELSIESEEKRKEFNKKKVEIIEKKAKSILKKIKK